MGCVQRIVVLHYNRLSLLLRRKACTQLLTGAFALSGSHWSAHHFSASKKIDTIVDGNGSALGWFYRWLPTRAIFVTFISKSAGIV
jgi:hypothetical protein